MNVADLIGVAGVSQASFYEHFSDVAECLEAAQTKASKRLRTRLRVAWAEGGEWPTQVRASVEASLRFASEAPELAALLLPTSLISEPRLAVGVWEINDFLVSALRAGSSAYPQATRPSELTDQVLVGGAQALIGIRLRAGDPGRLTMLADGLTQAILLPYLGADVARDIARAGGDGRP